MADQVIVNLSANSTSHVHVEKQALGAESSHQFSDHFDHQVRHKNKTNKSVNDHSGVGVNNPQDKGLVDNVEGGKASATSIDSAPKHSVQKEGSTIDEAIVVSVPITVEHSIVTLQTEDLNLDDSLGLVSDKVLLSGNTLPIAATFTPQVTETVELIDSDMPAVNLLDTKQIAFDPLANAVLPVSFNMPTAMVAEKFAFNANRSIVLSTLTELPVGLDKLSVFDIQQVMLGKGFKVDSTPLQKIQVSLAKPEANLELPNASLGGVLNSQSNLTGGLTDRPMLQLEVPVNSPKWGQELGQRVQWMVNQSLSGAQIRITPQHMGPIEVRVLMQNDQANIAFTAQHGATREAIEAALPRLRDALSEQNVNVVNVDVSQHSFAEQREHQADSENDSDVSSFRNDQEMAESIFDEATSTEHQRYDGLFNGFA